MCGAHRKELIHLFTYSLIYFNIVILRTKPEESHGDEVLRFALDDGTDIINVTLNLFQGLIAVKTRHFDKMLKQVQHDNFSCAKHTEKDLSSNRPTVLTTLKKAGFAFARNDGGSFRGHYSMNLYNLQ